MKRRPKKKPNGNEVQTLYVTLRLHGYSVLAAAYGKLSRSQKRVHYKWYKEMLAYNLAHGDKGWVEPSRFLSR